MKKTALNKAAEVLRSSGVILYPTDTIWGLGCDATDDQAVARIYEIKKRTSSKSLLVLVSSFAMLRKYVQNVPDEAEQIIASSVRPVTVIYDRVNGLARGIYASDGSVAIRVVRLPAIAQLIESFGKPIVSTSANISGTSQPEGFDDIAGEIIEQADYILRVPHYVPDTKASRIIRIRPGGNIEVIRE